MITGRVNASREAVVSIVVIGARSRREIEAVIDTGFDGHLTLPPSLIASIGIPFRERGNAVLGDGSETSFDIHDAEIIWDENSRPILVDAADTEPLIGTSLLEGHELTVRFVDDGDIFIERMPRLPHRAPRG